MITIVLQTKPDFFAEIQAPTWEREFYSSDEFLKFQKNLHCQACLTVYENERVLVDSKVAEVPLLITI